MHHVSSPPGYTHYSRCLSGIALAQLRTHFPKEQKQISVFLRSRDLSWKSTRTLVGIDSLGHTGPHDRDIPPLHRPHRVRIRSRFCRLRTKTSSACQPPHSVWPGLVYLEVGVRTYVPGDGDDTQSYARTQNVLEPGFREAFGREVVCSNTTSSL